MIIERVCWVCNISRSLDLPVTEDGIRAWRGGALIQDVFPSLSDDQREFLITGTHPDCWVALFGD